MRLPSDLPYHPTQLPQVRQRHRICSWPETSAKLPILADSQSNQHALDLISCTRDSKEGEGEEQEEKALPLFSLTLSCLST